jgi:hypothetical protein
MYRTGPRAEFAARHPSAGHLLTRRLNEDLITGMRDGLLRVAPSVRGRPRHRRPGGPASCARPAPAGRPHGRDQGVRHAAPRRLRRPLADETCRRRIGRQLNKGENLHALKRSLAYPGAGVPHRRRHEQQAEQMWCLTLATNAVVWATEYHGLAVTALRRAGQHIDDAVLARIWPAHHENVHFYGAHSVDVDGELAKLDSGGYRPLRATAAAQA